MVLRLLQGYLKNTLAGLVEPAQLLLRRRALVRLLVRREITSRTSGTLLGGLWILLQPALQIGAFWFLFGYILQIRGRGPITYIDYLLVGMPCWLLLAEMLNRSTAVLIEFSSIYRRNLFPLALLPLLPPLVSGGIYALVYPLLVAVVVGPGAAPFALGAILILVVWVMPLAYILSVMGLFFRDAAKMVPFVLTLTMYTTPILFTPQMVSQGRAAWLLYSPFADLMAIVHAAVQSGPLSAGNLLRPFLLWLLLLGPAWALFRRTEPHMREVL